MTTVIVDYGSGNLHSARKAFERMATETAGGEIAVSAEPEVVAKADRVVLPGVGAYADCKAGLAAIPAMIEAIETHVAAGRPFLGICVGMQLMATRGLEHGETPGFDWIPGDVIALEPNDPELKVPHMGWNELIIGDAHPVLAGLGAGAHAYFVHSYHLRPRDPDHRLAHVHHGEMVAAVVGRDSMVGTQFHPEKSQETGLRLIANFLHWNP